MTKAIKFNLLLDKHPVRDLTDLRANFNLDDLLTAYHSQVLHRWLEVRGLSAELSQLQEIAGSDELTIARALCQLFHADISEAQIQAAVYSLEFREQQRQQLEVLASQEFQRNTVIKSYHAGYEQLCEEMLEKTEDYPFLKAAVNTLWADYEPLFRVDFDLFFALFIEQSPLTLYTMLANEAYRQSELFDKERKEIAFSKIPSSYKEKEGKAVNVAGEGYDWKTITDQKVFIKSLKNASGRAKIRDKNNNEYVGDIGVGKTLVGLSFYSYGSTDNIKYAPIILKPIPLLPPYQSYAGATEGYWKDLEPEGTKCLILKMENGNFIRNAGKNGEELNAEAVNKEFLILDGIDYKSNNANHALIYLVI